MHVPIAHVNAYHPSFKVESCLHEKLWQSKSTNEDLMLEIFAMCARLECLVVKYSMEEDDSKNDSKSISIDVKYKPFVQLEINKIEERIKTSKLSQLSLEDYMRSKGFSVYFPHLNEFLTGQRLKVKKKYVQDYFSRLLLLNQLKSICEQMHQDLLNLPNHKYFAHQTALLYHAISDLGSPLENYKTEVERLFPLVKSEIKEQIAEDRVPYLSTDLKMRLEMIVGALYEISQQFVPELCQPIFPVLDVI